MSIPISPFREILFVPGQLYGKGKAQMMLNISQGPAGHHAPPPQPYSESSQLKRGAGNQLKQAQDADGWTRRTMQLAPTRDF